MNTYLLNIASPDGKLFSGMVKAITLRGAEGDLMVMAGHIPFITSVQPCVCAVHLPDGSIRRGRVQSGLLTVDKDEVTLLTNTLTWEE